MSTNNTSATDQKEVNLNNCDKEPVHIIGKIQNHGVLIACHQDTKTITRASDNTNLLFNKNAESLLNTSIKKIINLPVLNILLNDLETRTVAHTETLINKHNVIIIVHKSDEEIVFEFEINTKPINAFKYQTRLVEIVSEINKKGNYIEKSNTAASLIKEYFDYDRVMIYQFDTQGNGSIIAEKKETHLNSFLGLQYPATDIPKQARKLMLEHNIRLNVDINSKPVNILSLKSKVSSMPLNLSRSELRSTSPIHVEYLTNMKVNATLTTSIIQNGKLWGLIACHNYSPKYINYHQRLSCKFLSEILASNILLNQTTTVLEKVKNYTVIRNKLIDQISDKKNIIYGLTKQKYTLNDLADSAGAAIYLDNDLATVGNCPKNDDIIALIKKIKLHDGNNFYHTSNLIHDFPETETFKKEASGVFCLFISKSKQDALIWFKPEVIETVHWAGNPDKTLTTDSNNNLTPRKSFQKWTVQQTGKSKTWEEHEIAAGISLQKSLLDIVIEKYEEVKELNKKLKITYEELESFSYSVSHDLRSPLRGIDGFAHILKEDYYDKFDDFGKSSIQTIITSVNKMNLLIDDILQYSGLGRKTIVLSYFSFNTLIADLLPDLQTIYPQVKIILEENLPDIYGDRSTVLLLVKNILENAMKYSSKVKKPTVNIGALSNNTFFIKDNGVGFNMKHEHQIFGVFNRLVNDEYPGSGIGLAIAKRIVERHNGEIWVESMENKGSTFYFKLKNK